MFLVLGCGKPITENRETDNSIEPPKSIFLRSVRSFDHGYVENAKFEIDSYTSGHYDLPVIIDMTASYDGRRGRTWLHIEHNGLKHCYLGYSDYYYDHSRKSNTDCSSDRDQVMMRRFKASLGPVHMRIEESSCKCGTVMAEAKLFRI